MPINIVSVNVQSSAKTGDIITPSVTLENTDNTTARVALIWSDDADAQQYGPDPDSQLWMGAATTPEPPGPLDLNGDGKVNVLDLTIAKNKEASGEWTAGELELWERAFYGQIMPKIPTQGICSPTPREMPSENVTWTLKLLKYTSVSGWSDTGISKSISITNTGGGDGSSGTTGFWSKYGKWILIGGGVLAAGAAAFIIFGRKK